LDQQVIQLLQLLSKFQDRAKEKNPTKQAKTKRRYVSGLREVLRGINNGKLKCVILAPNIDENKARDGLDDKIQQILKAAKEKKVHIIHSLTRKRLGKAIGKSIRVSCVGIHNPQSADVYNQVIASGLRYKCLAQIQRRVERRQLGLPEGKFDIPIEEDEDEELSPLQEQINSNSSNNGDNKGVEALESSLKDTEAGTEDQSKQDQSKQEKDQLKQDKDKDQAKQDKEKPKVKEDYFYFNRMEEVEKRASIPDFADFAFEELVQMEEKTNTKIVGPDGNIVETWTLFVYTPPKESIKTMLLENINPQITIDALKELIAGKYEKKPPPSSTSMYLLFHDQVLSEGVLSDWVKENYSTLTAYRHQRQLTEGDSFSETSCSQSESLSSSSLKTLSEASCSESGSFKIDTIL